MENISLFDSVENQELQIGGFSTAGENLLDVVRLEFVGAETMTWRELFAGFDTLHAITYSSGIGFICQLLGLFEDAEIIFGCDAVISYSLQEVMAYQDKLLERMRSTASKMKMDLVSKIDEGSLRFFVASKLLSHEKIYLLSSCDGRKRVVIGSANMSFNAFGGKQRENICFVDGESAYGWYMGCYQELRDNSTDSISKKAFVMADTEEHIEDLPISEAAKVRKVIVIEPVEEFKEDVQFVLDVNNLSKKLSSAVPKVRKADGGKLLLTLEKIKSIRRQIVSERNSEKALQKASPELEIYVSDGFARLNGKDVDLAPSGEAIAHDVQLFLKYMNGYEKFHGDFAGMQRRYFEFANWFFCSPFMAPMRDMAVRYNQNTLPYPVFGLVYGQSKAGKTSFLETLLTMMIGQKTKLAAPDFTRSSIEGLKHSVKGAPIIVDDLTQTRFNQHAIETIKNDDFGVAEHLVHYPAVVISANEDVKAVAPEVIRRTVICRVQAGLTNTEVMRNNIVRSVQKEIGTAFYREYVRRMLGVVPDMMEDLKSDDSECAPDLLAASSKIIIDILKEYSSTPLPEYVRELSLDDYFHEKVTGSYAIKTIRDAWKVNKKAFEISAKNNELRYNAGQTWDADRLMKELPETLEAHKAREWVVMNLDEARKFFEVDFKRSFWDGILRK